MRVVAFVDGFNLYHAVHDLGANHLKWLDLRALVGEFAPSPTYSLERVLYFTAYATWKKDAWKRHRAYTAALGASGVEVVLSTFKKKSRRCPRCKRSNTWHEEKETDVNIGARLVDLAYKGEYDRALLVSGDSDLCPAIQIVRSGFPTKQIQVVGPPGRPTTKGLADAAGRPASRIKKVHVERALFPQTVRDSTGQIVANRPVEYDPP